MEETEAHNKISEARTNISEDETHWWTESEEDQSLLILRLHAGWHPWHTECS